MCCAAAGLVAPQHSSGGDAEAGAAEADPPQTRRGLAQAQLPFQTPKPVQGAPPAAQLHCEATRARRLSLFNPGCAVGCVSLSEATLTPSAFALGLASLPDGVAQTCDGTGGLRRRLALLPPAGHQHLCRPSASTHEKERPWTEGHFQQRSQRASTAPVHTRCSPRGPEFLHILSFNRAKNVNI